MRQKAHWAVVSFLLAACSFDATGLGPQRGGGTFDGEPGDDGAGTDDSLSGSTSASDDGGNTGDGDTGCDDPVTRVVLVEDAVVTPPMESMTSRLGEGVVAYSAVEDAGTVEFELDIPCDDEYALWGRVNDVEPGPLQYADPDSYYVTVDDGLEHTWLYGCGTEGAPQWSWQRMSHAVVGSTCDDISPIDGSFTAGTHTVVLRNREPAASNRYAAIARILATNDPTLVPDAH
jgi:hypothetical protein